MILAIEILAIITMCVLTLIAVWSFITLKQIFNQLKYRNYLLEKLNLHIYNLSKNNDIKCKDDDIEKAKNVFKV
ncbi:hypothetical protein CLLI_11170 [Clostridium liquoris]|jgi:biopolymer transport protein ExbB/TolQ|uniref:Uncharacterized protein n=1 Tax=Clostridium liquoris TaxID=1289519 RepID=A0A2T0B5C1_9CLOT|nr:hypothetical protein [Clostridium liquoris]PRR79076.1 hypothetical protein CLLI_11170 [Clostridium liquoris]